MATPKPAPGSVSLVIAATGHIDLFREDSGALEAEVRDVLMQLTKEYLQTPFLLLSGLAEGSDRTVVRAAESLKIPYMAILPMPQQYYRRDFGSEASNEEFQSMLAGAVRTVELPLAEGNTPENIGDEEPRNRQYEQLGEFLVNYSQILIALWDRKVLNKCGGTSDVVAMKLGHRSGGARLTASRLNGNGAGPVYAVLARRLLNGPGPLLGETMVRKYPPGTSDADYAASYTLLNQYNRDLEENRSKLETAAAESHLGLFGNAKPTGLTPSMNWLADVYSWADVLAMHFQRHNMRVWEAVFILLAVAGAGMTWLHTFDGGWRALSVYWACLALGFGLGFWEVKGRRRNKHEDYRALAEALRVQFFWIVAGLSDIAAENYLPRQIGEMAWIRDAMSECGLHDGVLERALRSTPLDAPRLGLAKDWVAGQANYFDKTKGKHERKKRNLNAVATTLLVIGLLSPAVGILIPGREFEIWSHALSATAMWWAALAWSYSERRGFVQEARQYERMAALFSRAVEDLNRFEEEGTPEAFGEAEETIRRLGKEALTENGDWLAMHRERRLTPNLAAG